MSEGRIRAHIPAGRGYVDLRGDPADEAFRSAAEAELGQALPTASNTFSKGEHRVYWLGPDEWLVATEAARIGDLVARLEARFTDLHVAINDVSGGNIAVHVSGKFARDLLAKGCTLDFHPDVFSIGHCAQSGLAKAGVLIGLLDAAPTFEIIVRRSFADYLEKWLRHAGRDRGIEFV